MARVTHVKKAQQRYETVPVIDPETQQPKKTPVMRNGEQRTTKRGKPIEMTVTVVDKTKPLAPYECDFCHQEIAVGTPYKHISPKSGPYGGTKRTRHEKCPTWQIWEYSSSLSARLAQISHDFWQQIDSAESTDDVQSVLDSAAEEITGLAEEKREGAGNIEEGFGHPTSASEELEQTADSLDEWADEITSQDIPEVTECEECSDGQKECDTCGGTGEVEEEIDGEDSTHAEDCTNCNGTGQVECDTCGGTGEDLDTWRSELQDSLTLIDESPV
jgi:hypothetical protein